VTLGSAFGEGEDSAESGAGTALAESMPFFTELSSALKEEDIGTIRRILNELEEKFFDNKTKEILNSVSNAVLMTEFEEAQNAIKELL
jgi:hypothetical protein